MVGFVGWAGGGLSIVHGFVVRCLSGRFSNAEASDDFSHVSDVSPVSVDLGHAHDGPSASVQSCLPLSRTHVLTRVRPNLR